MSERIRDALSVLGGRIERLTNFEFAMSRPFTECSLSQIFLRCSSQKIQNSSVLLTPDRDISIIAINALAYGKARHGDAMATMH